MNSDEDKLKLLEQRKSLEALEKLKTQLEDEVLSLRR